MAQNPELEPSVNLYGDKDVGRDDSTPVDGIYYFRDKRPVLDTPALNQILNERITKLRIKNEAISFVATLSSSPERTIEQAETFLVEHFGTKVVDDGPIIIINGISGFVFDNDITSVGVLSTKTFDQFAAIFWSNLTTFDDEDVKFVSGITSEALTTSIYVMALYEHFLHTSTCCTEAEYKRHVRAAKRMLQGLVGDNSFTYNSEPQNTREIFGRVAFDLAMKGLDEHGFSDDPGYGCIDRFRAKQCLRAFQATGDEFFVGVAAPMSRELAYAHLQAAINLRIPKAV